MIIGFNKHVDFYDGFRPALSLRGAKRRGNPHPKRCDFLSVSVKTPRVKGNGLPRQCAHWRAMTAFFEHLQEICCCLLNPIVIIGICRGEALARERLKSLPLEGKVSRRSRDG